MVKQRMSSVDVAAEVACLRQRILGLRVANIYDLTPKTYVVKLARSGEEGEKVYLLLESGARFHTTKVLREKSSELPSNFTLKLRKHCRTRRVEAVRQLGVDRCMELTLGSGPAAVHLILEMYAQGNIVLTDSRYEVLTLLRSHRDDAKGLVIMARHPYPMAAMRLAVRVGAQQLDEAARGADSYRALLFAVLPYGPTIAEHVALDAGLDPAAPVPLVPQPEDTTANSTTGAAGTAAAEDGPDGTGLDGAGGVGLGGGGEEEEEEPQQEGGKSGGAGTAVAAAVRNGVLPDDIRQSLLVALGRLYDWFARMEAGEVPRGYITLTPPGSSAKANKKKSKAKNAADPSPAPSTSTSTPTPLDPAAAAAELSAGSLVYGEFNPLQLLPYAGMPYLDLPSFNDAMDDYFSKVEGQRADVARAEVERAAMSRLDKIKQDQGSRAEALLRQAEEAELKAQLITYNREAVEAAVEAVNSALATGMDWSDLDILIREERRSGNPVAGLIASLALADNAITLMLANTLDEGGEEGDEAANNRRAVKVSVELSLSAHANASAYFETRRRHLAKHAKTLAANTAALAAAEKKAEAALKQVRSAPAALQPVRKPLWFERFHWFISSENYLVVSGRDAQQNELLVKRYFRRGDVYVHAELHGASSTIVKNSSPDHPIPPLTLQQAGAACMCRSRAWDSKIVTSAWWVHHHQVSKTAPTGEYLTTGSFMIRGKKNFLPPQPLVMGFGFLFKMDDSSIPAHLGERAVRGLDLDASSVAPTAYGRPYDGTSEGVGGGGDAGATGLDSDDEEVDIPDGGDNDDEAPNSEDPTASAAAAATDATGGLTEQALTASATRRSAAAATAVTAPSPLDRFLEGSYDMPYGATPATATFDRYGLTQDAAAADDNGNDADGSVAAAVSGAVSGRRHLSAKERALLKKQAGGAGAGAASSVGGGGGGGGAGRSGSGPAGGAGDDEFTIVAPSDGGGPGGSGRGSGGAVAGGASGGGAKSSAAVGGGGGKGAGQAATAAVVASVGGGGGGKGQGAAGKGAGAGGPVQQQGAKGGGGGKGAGGGGGGGGKGGGGKAGSSSSAAAAAVQPAPAASQRGKKGKQAKAKDKYADQDEEERALALTVLGSAGDKKSRADRRKQRKERKEVSRREGLSALAGDEEERQQAIERATGKQFLRTIGEEEEDGSEDVDDVDEQEQEQQQGQQGQREGEGGSGNRAEPAAAAGATGKRGGGGGDDAALEEADEEEAVEAGADEGATESENAEIAALLAAEAREAGGGGGEGAGAAPAADDDAARLSLLDSLTGLPRPEDVLLFAVPVCGPYTALQSYKYKIKVTPGTVKKGKAARQAIELLTRGPEVPPREREILRGVPEMEAINALVGPGVKLSMPGLQKLKTEDKQSRKAKAKARVAAGTGEAGWGAAGGEGV